MLAGCLSVGSKAGIGETRMVQVPPREPNFALELVTVDTTATTFNQQWEVIGYVAMGDTSAQDPAAEENRAIVRPRACAMGGTSVAVAGNSTATGPLGNQGSALVYMILRPKPEPAALPPPTAF